MILSHSVLFTSTSSYEYVFEFQTVMLVVTVLFRTSFKLQVGNWVLMLHYINFYYNFTILNSVLLYIGIQ